MGLAALNPIAQVMVRQMLFLDRQTTRLRALASAAFPHRVELCDRTFKKSCMDCWMP